MLKTVRSTLKGKVIGCKFFLLLVKKGFPKLMNLNLCAKQNIPILQKTDFLG